MKAVIMAGGFGTRLRPLTAHRPKPMVPVGNVPIMEHTVRLLRRHGFTDLLVLLYFLPEVITDHFGDGSRCGVRMTYVTPPSDMGTAGALKFAAAQLAEPVLVISGDLLTDFELAAVTRFHRQAKAEATMVLTRVESLLQYGIVITEGAGRIARFLEKPSWGEVFSDTINTGIYVLEPTVFESIPAQRPYDFGKELFPALLEAGRSVYGFVAEGYWRDVGDLVEYRIAHLDLLQGELQAEIPGRRVTGPSEEPVWLDEDARVDTAARLIGGVIVGRGARVEPGARITNSVIGPGTVIREGAEVEGSVLWDEAEVGSRAVLKEAIVGRGVAIRSRAFLAEGVVVGDFSRIGAGSVVKANAKVWPYKEVEDGGPLRSAWSGENVGRGRSSGGTGSPASRMSRSLRSLRPSWARPWALRSAGGAAW